VVWLDVVWVFIDGRRELKLGLEVDWSEFEVLIEE
jgi:hypothetical protein